MVVVGSVAYDALESPYGKVERTLGGAATYFSVAASFFSEVDLVAVVGDDFSENDLGIFRGRTRQYLHISTASLYRKPVLQWPIVESNLRQNPFVSYSRDKIAAGTPAAAPAARSASAIPGISRSSTRRVISGVRSSGVSPVPPVVTTTS